MLVFLLEEYWVVVGDEASGHFDTEIHAEW